MKALVLSLFAALALVGCGLFGAPKADSPYPGLYCVGVGVVGVPGYFRACYDTESEAVAEQKRYASEGKKATLLK